MNQPTFIPLDFLEYDQHTMLERAQSFREEMKRRRTVRDFSDRKIPREIIEQCLLTAGSAVSGANMQPWQFVVIEDPATKQRIRVAAEKEEKTFYETKAPADWLKALEPLGTDASKGFLETAPCLIAIFQQRFGVLPGGEKVKHYYATESVGIATGFLISALHHAGLASLTHTPSPMGFLNKILDRPRSERPFLLLVVGYPAEDAMVPDIHKKTLEEIARFL